MVKVGGRSHAQAEACTQLESRNCSGATLLLHTYYSRTVAPLLWVGTLLFSNSNTLRARKREPLQTMTITSWPIGCLNSSPSSVSCMALCFCLLAL